MTRMIDADALMVWLVNMLNEFDDGNDPHEIKREMFQVVLAKTRKMPTVGGWVSVKDRLPEIDERVLVFGVGKYEYFVGSTMTAITCMSDANLIDCRLKTQPYWLEPWQYYLTDYEITHWMPLPEPPKEAEDDAEQ